MDVTAETEPTNNERQSADFSVQGPAETETKLSTFALTLLPWPTTTSQCRDRDKPWQNVEALAELCQLPAGDAIPHELKEILEWSLLRHEVAGERETPAGSTSIRTPAEVTSSTPIELPVGDLQSSNFTVPPETSRDLQDPFADPPDTSNDSKDIFLHESRSKSREQGLSKLHHLGSAILGSPTDLRNKVSRLHLQLDQARAARAAREAKLTAPVECISCFEEVPNRDATTLSCTHAYCKTCFIVLITTAMQTESSYPPKCCLTPIPLNMVLLALNMKQRADYKDKAAEYSVLAADRWYCPRAKCAKFIPAVGSRTHHGLSCPHCLIKICRSCRGEAHGDGTDCPEDFGLNAALEEADLEGWQRCYRCRTMVELSIGCRHITCECGAEFCYVCGLRWRTCACTEADLVNTRAANNRRRADRDAAAQAEELELAEAIRDVEAYERSLEAERAIEARRLEEERREEAVQLARLEQMWIQEEEERRLQEEEAEQQHIHMQRLSIVDRAEYLQDSLQKLVHFQQSALMSRHEEEERTLTESVENYVHEQEVHTEKLRAALQANTEKRRQRLQIKHEDWLSAFSNNVEGREDEMFLQAQAHLRGKPNREARVRRMQEEFQKQLYEEREEREQKYKIQLQQFEEDSKFEIAGLEKATATMRWLTQERKASQLKVWRQKISREHGHFEFITKRRRLLLSVHNNLKMEELDRGDEPVGLTANIATTTMALFLEPATSKGLELTEMEKEESALPSSQRDSTSTNSGGVKLRATPSSVIGHITPTPGRVSNTIIEASDPESGAIIPPSQPSLRPLTPAGTPEGVDTHTHRFRTTMRTTSIASTSTPTPSISDIALSAYSGIKQRSSRWSLGKFVSKGKNTELTEAQIGEMLRKGGG